MSRFTQQQGNKIDCFVGFFSSLFYISFISITPRSSDLIVSLLAKHGSHIWVKQDLKKKKKKDLWCVILVLCKYALLYTSISCYTSTVTSIFHIAVCNSPCGVNINKDKCGRLHFQFSVLCLRNKFQSCGSTFHVCLFPWELLLSGGGGGGHLTESVSQRVHKGDVRFVHVTRKYTFSVTSEWLDS